MDLQAMSLTVIAGGILLAPPSHPPPVDGIASHTSPEHRRNSTGATSDFDQKLSELVNIGSDVADALEGVISRIGSSSNGAVTVADEPLDVKATVLSLITDRLMAGFDGNKTQSERAIHQEDDTQTTGESVDESEAGHAVNRHSPSSRSLNPH